MSVDAIEMRRPPPTVPIIRMIRRQEWLAAAVPEDASAPQAPPDPIQSASTDKYGIDLTEFKMKSGRKPREFRKCARIAEWTVDRKFCLRFFYGMLVVLSSFPQDTHR